MKIILTIASTLALTFSAIAGEPSFNLPEKGLPDRIWVGPNTWANRLQDWRIQSGRIECIPEHTLPMRTLHLLSNDLNQSGGSFTLSVELGRIQSDISKGKDGEAGFLIGAGNGKLDYRGAALIHQTPGTGAGIFVGVDSLGRVFIHDNEKGLYFDSDSMAQSEKVAGFDFKNVTLICSAKKKSADAWELEVQAKNTADGAVIGKVSATVPASRLVGNIALAADPGQPKKSLTHFWFNHWKGEGDRLAAHSDRQMGPIVGTHYTISRKILKVSAQMMPLPADRLKGATLEIKKGEKWEKIATADIDPIGFTALFRVENWDDTQKVPYRVTVPKLRANEKRWSGTFQSNPRDKEEFVLAALTGNHNISHTLGARKHYNKKHKGNWVTGTWFPHSNLTASLEKQQPDLLFFSGDQVYESDSPSYADNESVMLDYLYKWYIYMWAFRDLTCDIPAIVIPDDHDVYQGNFWGQGGRHANRQYDGGFTEPAEFVKMVERTQTANLPDPFDPTPVAQGIGVYYTDLNWGKVSFAVIEDRKFKTGPNSEEAKSGDESKLVLLGKRQLSFLETWVGDWSDGAAMKASLSATVFSQLHTWRNKDGSIEQDPDTNGWPVGGRNRALSVLRKGFTMMVGGDQHLGTAAQHGIDDWGDSGWSLCVPSIANYFPRSWKPIVEGKNRKPGMSKDMGDFLDGWGNKVTMYAVANPIEKPKGEASELNDKVPGYGIVKFNQKTRKIEMANWPLYATVGNGKPYAGWPITIDQTDNYGRKPTAWLPEIKSEIENPVVEIIEKKTGKLVYAIRIKGKTFTPGVFAEGLYTVKVGDPDTKKWTESTVQATSKKPVK